MDPDRVFRNVEERALEKALAENDGGTATVYKCPPGVSAAEVNTNDNPACELWRDTVDLFDGIGWEMVLDEEACLSSETVPQELTRAPHFRLHSLGIGSVSPRDIPVSGYGGP